MAGVLNEAADNFKYKDAGFPTAAMNDNKLEAEMIAALKTRKRIKNE